MLKTLTYAGSSTLRSSDNDLKQVKQTLRHDFETAEIKLSGFELAKMSS